jgi:hypothetical protein
VEQSRKIGFLTGGEVVLLGLDEEVGVLCSLFDLSLFRGGWTEKEGNRNGEDVQKCESILGQILDKK